MLLASLRAAAADNLSLDPYIVGQVHKLPARPVLYVKVPSDLLFGLPIFTLPDGTRIPGNVQRAALPETNLWRIQLDVVGTTWIMATEHNGYQTSYVVDAEMKPQTRSVTVDDRYEDGQLREEPWVTIDSDAMFYVVQCGNQPRALAGGTFRICGTGARVFAIYPDGTQAQILDYRPPVGAVTTAAWGAMIAMSLAGIMLLVVLMV